ERARLTMFGQLSQGLNATNATSEQLRNETVALARALSSANVRGTWGEMQLRRVIEFSGMIEHCDFHEQCTIDSGNGRIRPDFVVLFLPSEAFLGLALQTDPTFFEHCFTQNVVVATPTTLIAMLKAVAYAWKQDAIAKNAKEISELGRELYDRTAKVGEHLRNVGNSLGKSVNAFNEAVKSLEGRWLPTARRFRELGAAGTKMIPELRLIDATPTGSTSAELKGTEADPSSLALL